MKPNNLYYREISEITNDKEYTRFHNSLYYMKEIAESYGMTYTGFNSSNKYLKDWAIALGYVDDGNHHYNRYYLRQIAEILYSGELEHYTENYLLRIIKENIGTHTPVATNIAITVNGETATSTPIILSYADGDTATYGFTVTDDNNDPVEGYSINITKGNEVIPLSTNSNGYAEYVYSSQGVGDIEIGISCTLVSETYSIRDVHYYADYSKIKSSWVKDTSVSGRTIYSYLNNVTNGTVLFKVNNLPNSFIVGIGKFYNGGQIKDMFVRMNSQNQHWYSTNSSENQSVNISQTVTANSIFKFVITNSHTIAFYVDDVLVATTNTRTSFNPTLRIDDFTASPLDLEYVIIL